MAFHGADGRDGSRSFFSFSKRPAAIEPKISALTAVRVSQNDVYETQAQMLERPMDGDSSSTAADGSWCQYFRRMNPKESDWR
ncbi:MAG TPA: hypothetical protein VGA88_06785 [Burkholderiales bacterium]